MERKMMAKSHPDIDFHPNHSQSSSRFWSQVIPLYYQNNFRDTGRLGAMADNAIKSSIPLMAIMNPRVAMKFVTYTQGCKVLRYGDHESNVMHLYELDQFDDNKSEGKMKRKGLVFFVHGGAWGSGKPWMYRLTAKPFIQELQCTTVILGYRTYPDSPNVYDQSHDIQMAIDFLQNSRPDLFQPEKKDDVDWMGISIVGHSSGAHIALLMLVHRFKTEIDVMRRLNRQVDVDDDHKTSFDSLVKFDSFVGISGPYNISHHFDFEAGRGVEEISPMKPACGFTREQFDFHSPGLVLLDHLLTLSKEVEKAENDNSSLLSRERQKRFLPRKMLFSHGIEDSTVPFTSTVEISSILRKCCSRIGMEGFSVDEVYLPKTEHTDTVMHFMLGGPTLSAVLDWFSSLRDDDGDDKVMSYLAASSRSKL